MRVLNLLLAFAAASVTIGTTAAVANPAQQQTRTEAKAAAKDAKEDRKICRRYERPGSHASEKVCLTKEQWERIEREG